MKSFFYSTTKSIKRSNHRDKDQTIPSISMIKLINFSNQKMYKINKLYCLMWNCSIIHNKHKVYFCGWSNLKTGTVNKYVFCLVNINVFILTPSTFEKPFRSVKNLLNEIFLNSTLKLQNKLSKVKSAIDNKPY